MIMPSKSIREDLALLTVGAQILQQLDSPATVTSLWERVVSFRVNLNSPSALPFWWFALALDLLYSIGAVELNNGEMVRSLAA
ncbi:MAG TPA: ABC-three component system middle component 6 [Streptosporangiaceae bacterium]|nr:ABC-three component system middle component 6 [Streptosporangiaceae bacterium]